MREDRHVGVTAGSPGTRPYNCCEPPRRVRRLSVVRPRPPAGRGVNREDLLVLDRDQVVAGGVQPPIVVPVGSLQGGELDVVQPSPAPAGSDEFGLEQPDVGLGQSVVQRVTDRADARSGAGGCQPLGERNGRVPRRRCGTRARTGRPRPRGRGSTAPAPGRRAPARCASRWPPASPGCAGSGRRGRTDGERGVQPRQPSTTGSPRLVNEVSHRL